MKLRELTAEGMNLFEADLIKFREEKLPNLNIDKYQSRAIDHNIDIDGEKVFANKLEAGKYFLELFSSYSPTAGIWNWLSLVFYKQLLKKENSIGTIQRLFVSPQRRSFYPFLNLLMPPYDICKFHKDHLSQIDFLLSDPVNVNGTIYEETARRSDIVKNINFMKVARELFYDSKMKKIKPVRGKRKGILRLIKIYKQYERGFDMYHMPSDKMIEIIKERHREFDIFW